MSVIDVYDQLLDIVHTSDESTLRELGIVLQRAQARIDSRLHAIEESKPKKSGPKPGTKPKPKAHPPATEAITETSETASVV